MAGDRLPCSPEIGLDRGPSSPSSSYSIPLLEKGCIHCGIYALLALGFDFLAHFVGLVSLGGAFFIGVGGYTAALLNKSLGLPPALTIPMATLGGAFICTLLLLPALPLQRSLLCHCDSHVSSSSHENY